MFEHEAWDTGIPEPWWYNPSSWTQRLRVASIAMIGVLISIYLGLYQWRIISDVWDPIFGDQSKAVLDSDVSHQMREWISIPDAILGTAAYLGDVIFALAGSERRWQHRPWLVILFGIDVIPLGLVSAILVFMQAVIVQEWCFLCLVSAVVSLVLIVFAYDEVLSSVLYLYRYWKKTRSWTKFWEVFWGYPNEEAVEIGDKMLRDRKYVGKRF